MTTKQKTVFIGLDGLIAIALASGMSHFTYAIDGEVCAVIIRECGMDFAYSYSMDDVRADGSGVLPVWREHFHAMFRSWSIGKAIREHFKDAVEAAERNLAMDVQ